VNPFEPVTPTVTEAEDPGASVTLIGCTVSVKSGEGGRGGPVPPPAPQQLASIISARIKAAARGSATVKYLCASFFMLVT
jgi:hypothetical protein